MLEYDFQPERYSLGTVFEVLETACHVLPITDYSISQNTLDNVSLLHKIGSTISTAVMTSLLTLPSISLVRYPPVQRSLTKVTKKQEHWD